MEIIGRALVMFLLLFIIIKLLGKKQIKNLTLYDYVLSITLGSIAADSIISLDTPLYDGMLALVVFGGIGYLSSLLTYHNHAVEELIDGEPLVLFENNNFNYENLEKAKLSVAKVLETCRLKGCFDIKELDCAVLEPSGDVSVLLKEKNKGSDSNNKQKQSLSYSLILDGSINRDEIKKAHKSVTWVNKYLRERKLKLDDISLLAVDKKGKVTLLKRD